MPWAGCKRSAYSLRCFYRSGSVAGVVYVLLRCEARLRREVLMQDIMNNSASAVFTPEGYEQSMLASPRETTLLGHENGAVAVPANDTAQVLTQEELARLKSLKQLLALLQAKALDAGKIKS